MKQVLLGLLALGMLALATPAHALCTSKSVTGSSTQIIGNTTIPGGRKYVSVQNVGTTGNIGCTIGSANTATSSNTIVLTVGQMYEYPFQATGYPPQTDVSCYAITGTQAATACEY